MKSFKRLLSVVTAVTLVLLLSVAASADLATADFENWLVECGPDGYTYDADVSNENYYTENPDKIRVYLEPGTVLSVNSFNGSDKGYVLILQDTEIMDKYNIGGRVFVSENEFSSYFRDAKNTTPSDKVVSPEFQGQQLDSRITCRVTAAEGINLQRGPDTYYQTVCVIPDGSVLTYDAVHNGSEGSWVYTSYNGSNGWVGAAGLKEISAEEAAAETTAAKTTVPVTSGTDIASATGQNVSPEDSSGTASGREAAPGFFDSTRNVIAVCTAGAVILAASAAAVLVILRKKKENGDRD